MTNVDMKSLLNNIILFIALAISTLNSLAQCYSVPILTNNKTSPYNLEDEGKFKEAFMKYKSTVDKTLTTSNPDLSHYFFAVGHFFAHGHGVTANVDSAIFYLEKAAILERKADRYSYNAHHLLSKIYYSPKYGKIDLNKSFKYLTDAADLGDVKSCLELGELFLNGHSYSIQDTTLITITQRVANDGRIYKSRCHSFGVKCTDEVIRYPFVEIDSIKGYTYYVNGMEVNKRLINKPYLLSDLQIATSYINGKYLPKDFDSAWEYLWGYLDENEDLSDLNLNEIKNRFQQSEVQNTEYGEAYWLISMLYRFGLGVRSDARKADYYMHKAASEGYPKAIEFFNL